MPLTQPRPDDVALEAALVRSAMLAHALLDELRDLPAGCDPNTRAELQLQAAGLAARVGLLLNQALILRLQHPP